ncbi:hypothetical protein CDAR_562911 [Caerostris darwini]|uniref:Uncharacterized protein n=1 Tax=Caerostris darwini TaxID=1538125 RepID=A0AAV4XA04_9ARAC|nr:hypothetical protein CDAR_562911 [Caerostris darwini]
MSRGATNRRFPFPQHAHLPSGHPQAAPIQWIPAFYFARKLRAAALTFFAQYSLYDHGDGHSKQGVERTVNVGEATKLYDNYHLSCDEVTGGTAVIGQRAYGVPERVMKKRIRGPKKENCEHQVGQENRLPALRNGVTATLVSCSLESYIKEL